jgi:hypothetical protein
MQTTSSSYGGPPAILDKAAEPAPKRIPAYAKLEFAEGFDFYIQTLSVTIGRRPPRPPQQQQTEPEGFVGVDSLADSLAISPVLRPVVSAERATSPVEPLPSAGGSHCPEFSTTPSPFLKPSKAPSAVTVDVDLGPIKAVSRDHARLYFDYQRSAWVLEVRGRNGVVVDGRWRARGEKVVLNQR